MHVSERPHGRLFTRFEIRIEAVPQSDEDIERLSNQLDEIGVDESLAAVARRIEEAIPDVRVEVVA